MNHRSIILRILRTAMMLSLQWATCHEVKQWMCMAFFKTQVYPKQKKSRGTVSLGVSYGRCWGLQISKSDLRPPSISLNQAPETKDRQEGGSDELRRHPKGFRQILSAMTTGPNLGKGCLSWPILDTSLTQKTGLIRFNIVNLQCFMIDNSYPAISVDIKDNSLLQLHAISTSGAPMAKTTGLALVTPSWRTSTGHVNLSAWNHLKPRGKSIGYRMLYVIRQFFCDQ